MFSKLNITNPCPECSSVIIFDNIKGEFICSSCGYVIEEHIEDCSQEGISFKNSTKSDTSRASGFNSISYHDYGLHTEIDYNGRDYTGKLVAENTKKSIIHLRKWNTIIRISNSKERRLSNVLSKINEISSSMSFPKVICETAALVYRNYEHKCDTKGKSAICMAAAATFYACKISSILRSLNEIVKTISADDDYIENLKLSSKYYRSMVLTCNEGEIDNENLKQRKITEFTKPRNQIRDSHINKVKGRHNIISVQSVTISQYISKLSNTAKFDNRVERLALELAKKTEDHLLSDGKSPNGIAAAYLYLASVLLGNNILQIDISKLSGVTEVTIRNRCKDILTSFKMTLRIKSTIK